jgi:hypothetical protein
MTDKYNTLRGAVAATLRMGAESRISIPGETVQALLDERDALIDACIALQKDCRARGYSLRIADDAIESATKGES